ncbi:MAG TPA: hypothetical protein VGK99_05985 [Acidobacteriota bacterium]|jgi:hypothetical protein
MIERRRGGFRLPLLFALLLICSAAAQEVLTNDAIVKMVGAGLSEDIILVKIQTSAGNYRLDTDSLLQLKAKNVSDRLIQAMMSKSSGAAKAAPDTATPKTDQIQEYELLATNRTSSMEKEMNAAALRGYGFAGLTFGDTLFGGKEVIVAMRRTENGKLEYKLLATSKTSTMDKELNEAAAQGYRFKEASYGETAAGGKEVITVLERPAGQTERRFGYKLIATNKTSTLKKEMNKLSLEGFSLVDVTYGETAFGGQEVIAVLEMEVKR